MPRVPSEYPVYLSSVRTCTMEGVCALRPGWRTFRRPGTKRARVRHPLEYPCPVPSWTKTHAASACCAGVSARHGPVQTHFTAQRDEPCTSQVFPFEQARRHDPGLAVGAQAVDYPVRPPRAPCRAVRVRASAGPLVSVSTPACACTHHRTAVRVPSPHVAVSTLAAAPRQWPSAVAYAVWFAVPPRVLVLCASPLRVPRTARSTAPRRSFHAWAHEYAASTPRVPCEL
jgi:hypothetical protein